MTGPDAADFDVDRHHDRALGSALNWVWWFNQIRRHGNLGHVPPVEFEATYC